MGGIHLDVGLSHPLAAKASPARPGLTPQGAQASPAWTCCFGWPRETRLLQGLQTRGRDLRTARWMESQGGDRPRGAAAKSNIPGAANKGSPAPLRAGIGTDLRYFPDHEDAREIDASSSQEERGKIHTGITSSQHEMKKGAWDTAK